MRGGRHQAHGPFGVPLGSLWGPFWTPALPCGLCLHLSPQTLLRPGHSQATLRSKASSGAILTHATTPPCALRAAAPQGPLHTLASKAVPGLCWMTGSSETQPVTQSSGQSCLGESKGYPAQQLPSSRRGACCGVLAPDEVSRPPAKYLSLRKCGASLAASWALGGDWPGPGPFVRVGWGIGNGSLAGLWTSSLTA